MRLAHPVLMHIHLIQTATEKRSGGFTATLLHLGAFGLFWLATANALVSPYHETTASPSAMPTT